MYTYLKGTLDAFTPSQAIVEVQGVGYAVFIPCNVLGQLPSIGDKVHFYTSFVVREFAHTLYGFLTMQERDIFEVLMNVTGIGPKLALSLVGHLSLGGLQSAITNEDLPSLCKVPGVGKKTAERLIVELRDKLSGLFLGTPNDLAIPISKDPKSQKIQDAMLAMVNLGYNQHTAQKAIKQSLKDLSDDFDLALLITTALKNV